jgi:hypothetical protein
MWANPALMHSTAPGHWEAEIIARRLSPLLEEDLERAVEEAGWALNWSGQYPLNNWCLKKIKVSYLGHPRSYSGLR